MKQNQIKWSWKRLVLSLAGIFFAFCVLPVGWVFHAGTVYSKDYSGWRFGRLRIGMTQQEVEKLMGPPLKKFPWPGTSLDGSVNEMWAYTWQADPIDSYYRRWVFFKNAM